MSPTSTVQIHPPREDGLSCLLHSPSSSSNPAAALGLGVVDTEMPPNSRMLANEEEVKQKIVVPLLRDRGVQLSELTFEKTFSLRAGRRSLEIGVADGSRSRPSARLDVLVKRNGKNLLVVETKAEGLTLTENDRDQATSYARLVHPIAPYAIVTNGSEWKVFDSISREEVVPDRLDPSKDGLRIVLPQELRDEALSFFLTVSAENLVAFSRAQVTEYMEPLRGSLKDLSKKFVPALHVRRGALDAELRRFFQGDKQAFVVVGDSGSGKTCTLCDVALTLLDAKRPVFFFTGLSLAGGLLDQLSAEFNWTFADQGSPIELLRRLEGLRIPEPLTVVVDAIDEWQHPTKVQDLVLTLRHTKPQILRFVLSCRHEAWSSFREQTGSPTGIESFLHWSGGGSSASIGTFSDAEFHQALENYREVFGFGGRIEDRLLDEARRNPFLLRVAFEVAKAAGLSSLSFSATELFKEYYRQLLRLTPAPDVAESTLSAVSRALFDRNAEFANELDLRSALHFSVNDRLEPVLFERNILVRRQAAGISTEVGFYFPQFRSFAAAFLALRWGDLDANGFRAAIASLQPGVQRETLAFYYRHATEAHRRVVDGPQHHAARRYLDTYLEVLKSDFPRLRSRFPGCGGTKTGFIGELSFSRGSLRYHGFREISDEDPDILFLPADELSDRSNLPYMYGADRLHWAGDIVGDDTTLRHRVLRSEITTFLEELIKTGGLVEETMPELARELVVALVHRAGYGGNPPCIGDVLRRFWDARTRQPALPIDCDEIEKSLLRTRYHRQFESERFEHKRQEERKAGRPGNPLSITVEDERWIEEHVDCALREREPLSRRYGVYPDLEKLGSVLATAIATLRRQGFSLSESAFHSLQSGQAAQWSYEEKDEVRDAVCALWRAFLHDYRQLVEVNFPTLASSFELYSAMPVRILVVVEPPLPEVDGYDRSWGVTLVKSPGTGNDNEVIPCDAVSFERSDQGWKVLVDGTEIGDASVQRTHLRSWTSGCSYNPLKVSLQAPLRKMVYDRIRDEFPAARAELFRRYGMSSN